MSTSTINLCGKWQFRQKGKGAYLPATVPGSVHTDLLANKLIPDPFAGDNELKLQWIEQTDWEYQREFVVTAKLLRQQRVELVCEGLDTVAAITVNGSKVASVENMFIGYRFNVKQILRPGRNSIHVHFTAPATYIKMHRHLCTCTPPNDPMGGSCVIRKEPCSFGWDWGPRLATSGIYLPIRIEGRPAWRISAVDVRQTHRIGAVSLSCVPAIDARSSKGISWRSRLSINGKLVAESKSLHLTVKNPKLWWPNGLGAQPLYTLTVELLHNGALVDTWTRRIGLRTITLDRHKDEWGQSFQFLVNGVPVFAKGANWVPAHSFQASVTREMYDDLLTSAVQANMNIIRAWGGGVYENDEFFDLCDEKGLLVWQDFMFACGLYPGNPAFLASVTREFEYQIPRLAHHASLALWCGNNELEMWLKGIIETPERKKAYEDIFYRILPAVTKRLNPARPYWPCSPHNPWGYEKGLVAGEKGGDTHDWAVWHGRMRPDHFERTNNRFVSEYGMQSYASIETTRQFADPKAVNVFDAVMENHQKCASGNSLIFHYIAQQYRFPRDFASLVYLSQANQAYVVKTAAEHYRRSMPRTMGSIYWQINDCWPVASWASIEFGGRW
jgi:beta-mannosidase